MTHQHYNSSVRYRLDACLGTAEAIGGGEKSLVNGNPVVPLLHFHASEEIEVTLLRWFGNICANGELADIARIRAYGMQGAASILEYDLETLDHFRNQVKGIDDYLVAAGYEGLQWARETIAMKNILNGVAPAVGERFTVTGLLLRKSVPGEPLQLVNVFMLTPATQKLAG